MEVTPPDLLSHPPHHSHLHALGYDSFRPGQVEVIRHLLAGRDVLAVLPTGSGKSLAYQLTAQLLPG